MIYSDPWSSSPAINISFTHLLSGFPHPEPAIGRPANSVSRWEGRGHNDKVQRCRGRSEHQEEVERWWAVAFSNISMPVARTAEPRVYFVDLCHCWHQHPPLSVCRRPHTSSPVILQKLGPLFRKGWLCLWQHSKYPHSRTKSISANNSYLVPERPWRYRVSGYMEICWRNRTSDEWFWLYKSSDYIRPSTCNTLRVLPLK